MKIENKERDLEKNLVKLYFCYFKINSERSNQNYPQFDRKLFPNVISNVRANFPDFGLYHSILNLNEVSSNAKIATGDAVDDLSDIIYDILEIKWRIKNNCEADGLWYFRLLFNSHTQRHLIDLLSFIKSKNG